MRNNGSADSGAPHEAIGDQIEKPKLVYLAQVNVGGVLEDEAADILFAYEIDVSVLLFPAGRTPELCF